MSNVAKSDFLQFLQNFQVADGPGKRVDVELNRLEDPITRSLRKMTCYANNRKIS